MLMSASPYKLLVDASSRLADTEFFIGVNKRNVSNARAMLEHAEPSLNSAQSLLQLTPNVPVEYHTGFFPGHIGDIRQLEKLSVALRLAGDTAAHDLTTRIAA